MVGSKVPLAIGNVGFGIDSGGGGVCFSSRTCMYICTVLYIHPVSVQPLAMVCYLFDDGFGEWRDGGKQRNARVAGLLKYPIPVNRFQ